jgi:hypothetical protein
MSDIFISYASEDRTRARELAEALAACGWSVWWDRKIPLGKSFDEVIEKALAEAKCVIVLWSAVSAASEWVRNEASEAKRRGILLPVFLEPVNAPLAFRLLNGANLNDWEPGRAHPEFDKLTERVAELIEKPQSTAVSPKPTGTTQSTGQSSEQGSRLPWMHFSLRLGWIHFSVSAVAVAAIAIAILPDRNSSDPNATGRVSPSQPETAASDKPPESHFSELEKALKGLMGPGGSVPATAVTTAFHVPDLGFRVAFIDPQKESPMLASLPPGALVMEVESSGAAAKAGIQVFDVIEDIAGRKLQTVDDLRQSIRKLGPGKTQFVLRRSDGLKTVVVDCPRCKAE